MGFRGSGVFRVFGIFWFLRVFGFLVWVHTLMISRMRRAARATPKASRKKPGCKKRRKQEMVGKGEVGR